MQKFRFQESGDSEEASVGLRNRQRSRGVPIEVLMRHAHVEHPVTWADWELAKVRWEERMEREARDAEWEMREGWKRWNTPKSS